VFVQVKIISSGGGDVLKFAGDAMIVLWPDDSADGIVDRLQRAAQCAVYIQQKLDQATIEDSVQLSVKIGIGVGMVSVIHIGGTHKRMEYLAVGDPLIQAFHAEHHAVPGQVLASPQVWNLLKDLPGTFTAAKISEDGFVSLCVHTPFAPVRQRRHKPFLSDGTGDEAHHHHHPLLEQRIRSYVPNSVLPMLLKASYEDDMKWANETRRVAVMFVNLGLEEHNMLAAGDVRQRDAMVQVRGSAMR
jgi:adenylate cyclase 10